MAKILFTAVVADMRNKLAGTVFSKNRYGAYARTKVTPVNPQTAAQSAVRSSFAAMASAWRGLTEAQRLSWINAAPAFPIFDIFGNSKILSGSALYNRLNLNLATIGVSPNLAAPLPVSVPSPTDLSFVADQSSNTLVLSSSVGVVPSEVSALIEATPLYGAGISFVKNKYRVMTVIESGDNFSSASLGALYINKFGPLVVGQKISIRVRFINSSSGQSGVALAATAVVVA